MSDMSKPGSKLIAIVRLLRLDKPIGMALLLWPTLWALWLANDGIPPAKLLWIFVIGTVLMRSAGCAVNDLADRHVDGAVARTRDRPLVTGAVSPNEAMLVAGALALLAFAMVVLWTNILTIALSLVGATLAVAYPFLKRLTHLPQLGLGAAFSWGIPMAFAASGAQLTPEMWLLFTANLVWTVAYDTEYAMVDRSYDLKAGIKSTAILFGELDRLMIGALQGLTLFGLVLAGQRFEMGAAFFSGLVLAAALLGWQQWLIRDREPAACFRAFLHNNYVGLAIFIGIFADYFFRAAG